MLIHLKSFCIPITLSRRLSAILLAAVWTISACIPAPNSAAIPPIQPTEAATVAPESVPLQTQPEEDPAPTPAIHPLEILSDLISALQSGDPLTVAQHIHYSEMPCTHQMGLGGPPKCEDHQNEGDVVAVFPILGPSGTYVHPNEVNRLILHAASVYAIHRVTTEAPEAVWPAGEYGIIVYNADDLSPSITVYVTGDKIVRATYHMDQQPHEVLEELTEEILHVADEPTGIADTHVAFLDITFNRFKW